MTLNLIELADRLESFIPRGDGYNSDYANTLAEAVEVLRAKAAPVMSSLTEAQDSLYYSAIDAPAEPAQPQDHACHAHPDAPHGFNRNASHTAGRYVCDCEGWVPPAQPPSQGGEAVEVVANIAVDAEGVVRDFTLEPGLDQHPSGYTVTSLMTVAQHKRLMAAKDGDGAEGVA